MCNDVYGCVRCGTRCVEVYGGGIVDAYRVGYGIINAAVEHIFLLEPVLLIVGCERYKGLSPQFVSGISGRREVARDDEEGGIGDVEGSGAGDRYPMEESSGAYQENNLMNKSLVMIYWTG